MAHYIPTLHQTLSKVDISPVVSEENLCILSSQVVHSKSKSGIICLGRNQEHLLLNYQFLMYGAEQKIRRQTIDKNMTKPIGRGQKPRS